MDSNVREHEKPDLKNRSRGRALLSGLFAGLALGLTMSSAFAMNEEQKLISIAKKLKPINDAQWNEIAGSKITDTYDIQKGDTLWDISKRLFGNSFYWPKVWSLNAGIPNPHVVSPGQKLAFNSGSTESVPQLAPESRTDAPAGVTVAAGEGGAAPAAAQSATPTVSNGELREYQKIDQNLWKKEEIGVIVDVAKYDDQGFDRDSKIHFDKRFSFRVPGIANDTTIPYLGEIVGTRRESEGLTEGDTVFLKSNSQDLQVGSTYTVFEDADLVRERKSDRSAYLYRSIAEVKIVGVKDELYVGVLSKAYDVVKRGMKVYPLLPLINDINPQPGRVALEALVLTSSRNSVRNSTQYHFVHFDRGIEDGVQIGNVFRIYDYFDPVTKKKITDSDFLVNADAVVVHATAQFSTALIIRSAGTFSRGDFAVMLTDVSDLTASKRAETVRDLLNPATKTEEDKELDELDELDRSSGEGLGTKEETEIKELDQWDKTKDAPAPEASEEPTTPSAADMPTDSAEKLPGSDAEIPVEQGAPQDPTLDETLDSPGVTPPGLDANPPPAHLQPGPEQTLEAPPPPTSSDGPPPMGSAEMPAEPMSPDSAVEPALPAPGSDQPLDLPPQ